MLLPLPSWKVNIPTRERSKRRKRSRDLEEHEDDDNGRVFFHEKYGRVRSLYLANVLDMVEKMNEEDDHQGAEKPVEEEAAAAAAAMKPAVHEELGSGLFYGHRIELLQNLSLLADTILKDNVESSSTCNRGPADIVVKEEDDHKIKRKKTCYGSSSGGGSGPMNKNNKKKKEKEKPNMMHPPLLPPAWMIDKFHQLGAPSGDYLRVSCKETESSDTNRNQNRLLLSKKIMEESGMLESLTEEEREEVNKPDGLSVVMVDGEKVGGYQMFFKFLTSANSYRIIGKWGDFVTESKLKPHIHTLHLCFFRLQADPRQLRLGVIKTLTGNMDAGPIGKHGEEEILQQERRRTIEEGKKPILHSFDLNFGTSDDA